MGVLLWLCQHKPLHLASFTIYGVTLVLLYMASTLYHSLHVPPERIKQLLMWDQVGIYLMIAGTYTPVCLVSLRHSCGLSLLSIIWGIALVGIIVRIAWKTAPPWLCVVVYVIMGWFCVTALNPLAHAFPGEGMRWIFWGGLTYTVGAIVFATKRPNLWPGTIGWHGLWHVFVLGGSACHFMLMLRFVAPAP